MNVQSLRAKPAVAAFVRYYLTDARLLAPLVGYVALPNQVSQEQLAQVERLAQLRKVL